MTHSRRYIIIVKQIIIITIAITITETDEPNHLLSHRFRTERRFGQDSYENMCSQNVNN